LRGAGHAAVPAYLRSSGISLAATARPSRGSPADHRHQHVPRVRLDRTRANGLGARRAFNMLRAGDEGNCARRAKETYPQHSAKRRLAA
jgi:hypothetical protein